MIKKSSTSKLQNSKKQSDHSVTPDKNMPNTISKDISSESPTKVAGYVQIRISKAVANQYLAWKANKFGKRQINLIKLNDQIIKEYIKNNPLK